MINTKFLVIGFISVLIISGFSVILINEAFLNSNPNLSNYNTTLSITSVTATQVSQSDYNSQAKVNNSPANIIYNLKINLNIIIYKSFKMVSMGLGSCSFGAKLINTPDWQLVGFIYNCPADILQTYRKGSYNFSIFEEIIPKNINYSPTYPIQIELSASSGNLFPINATSQPYVISISNKGYSSINLNNSSLNTENFPNGALVYTITSFFDVITDHEINITYGCSSPFNMELLSNNTWKLSRIDCDLLLTHIIPMGKSEYKLSSELINPNGQVYGYSTPLPNYFLVQVSLGQNVLLSNIYKLVLS